jgi:plastocyanin
MLKLGRWAAPPAGFVAAAALLTAASSAWAAPANITTNGPQINTFTFSSFAHDAGTVATLTHTGGGPHDATAFAVGPDGGALFRSKVISAGSTPVNGTEYVPAGSYGFVCTVHPGMTSTLTVSGTPLPRPSATLKLLSTKIDSVAGKGKLLVRVTGRGSSTIDLDAFSGKRKIGVADDLPFRAGANKLALKLSKSGRSALQDRSQANLRVTGIVDFGGPTRAAKRKLG